MADVKWIKICTDIFNDEKILLIENLPEADSIIVIWFKLLCMAGKQNNGGVFMMNDKIAYTDEMLATIFRKNINTVRLALATFEQYGMIEIVNNTITIPNWEKHQSLDKLEQAKEKNRQRVAAHRERQKLLASGNDYSNVTVTPCNDVDKEEDKDIEEDKEKNITSAEAETASTENAPKCSIYLPLIDGTEYGVQDADIDMWRKGYPAIDIIQELHKMKAWLDANPKNRKTYKGIKRFIIGWLGKAQNSAPKTNNGGKQNGQTNGNNGEVGDSHRYGTWL